MPGRQRSPAPFFSADPRRRHPGWTGRHSPHGQRPTASRRGETSRDQTALVRLSGTGAFLRRAGRSGHACRLHGDAAVHVLDLLPLRPHPPSEVKVPPQRRLLPRTSRPPVRRGALSWVPRHPAGRGAPLREGGGVICGNTLPARLPLENTPQSTFPRARRPRGGRAAADAQAQNPLARLVTRHLPRSHDLNRLFFCFHC